MLCSDTDEHLGASAVYVILLVKLLLYHLAVLRPVLLIDELYFESAMSCFSVSCVWALLSGARPHHFVLPFETGRDTSPLVSVVSLLTPTS